MKKEYFSWFLKGLAMGAADAVPGVSGGTIALITGVYERFIAALASFKPSLWSFVKQKDIRGLWHAIDGTFLACLGSGIVLSLFTALSLMHVLLEAAAPVVWSFFMGVIISSLWFLSLGQKWTVSDGLLFVIGLIISVTFATASGVSLSPTPLILIFGGMLAISAMLLPGVSGSFMLVLLGLYPVILEAVHIREFDTILWVATGCGIGIISFSRALQYLLLNWHDKVIRFMLGFIVGALIKVWPWQDSGHWYFPNEYLLATDKNHLFIACMVALVFGLVIVVFMHWQTRPANVSR